ncbi:MAG: VCBS repeat-containing protein [Candidatus Acidiferrum sp.]
MKRGGSALSSETEPPVCNFSGNDGVTYSDGGRPRSGMGVDSADFNNDGWQDLFVANIDREMFSIYKNNRDGTFDDLALPTGIGKARSTSLITSRVYAE